MVKTRHLCHLIPLVKNIFSSGIDIETRIVNDGDKDVLASLL